MQDQKRTMEIFSAGCPCCEAAIAAIRSAACPSCAVTVHDMRDPDVEQRAQDLGVRGVPAVAIDGKLSPCCSASGPDLETLLAAGLGAPLVH